jgi:cobalt-zinc-cadmium efflux system membrane fusion protein
MTNRLFLLAVALVFQQCNSNPGKSDTSAAQDANTITLTREQQSLAGIELGTPVQKTLKKVIKANGMLDVPPQSMVTIAAPMAGFVKSTKLLQGMPVKKGDVLAELYHQDYIQLQQEYLNTKSQLEFLKAEYDRQLELSSENINATKTLQRAKADYESAGISLQALKARLALINLTPDQLIENGIQQTIQLYSPINGFVTEVNVNPGKFVNPSDVLFKIIDPRHLHVELYVFEKDLPALQTGQTVNFSLVDEQNVRQASVYIIGKEISPERTVRIHCHMSKDYPELIPGLYLKAWIETSSHQARVIPEEAVVTIENKRYVFVTTDETTFTLVEINTGVIDSGNVEILDRTPVTNTAQVVIKGAYTLLSMLRNAAED